jgi:hypothetical protein
MSHSETLPKPLALAREALGYASLASERGDDRMSSRFLSILSDAVLKALRDGHLDLPLLRYAAAGGVPPSALDEALDMAFLRWDREGWPAYAIASSVLLVQSGREPDGRHPPLGRQDSCAVRLAMRSSMLANAVPHAVHGRLEVVPGTADAVIAAGWLVAAGDPVSAARLCRTALGPGTLVEAMCAACHPGAAPDLRIACDAEEQGRSETVRRAAVRRIAMAGAASAAACLRDCWVSGQAGDDETPISLAAILSGLPARVRGA